MPVAPALLGTPQIFAIVRGPSWLSSEHGVPTALIGRLCRAPAALSASCASRVSLPRSLRGWKKQTGCGPGAQRATWERSKAQPSPPTGRDTGTEVLVILSCWLEKIKVLRSPGRRTAGGVFWGLSRVFLPLTTKIGSPNYIWMFSLWNWDSQSVLRVANLEKADGRRRIKEWNQSLPPCCSAFCWFRGWSW